MYLYVCTHIFIYVYKFFLFIRTYMATQREVSGIHTFIYTDMHVYTYTDVCVYIYWYVYIDIYDDSQREFQGVCTHIYMDRQAHIYPPKDGNVALWPNKIVVKRRFTFDKRKMSTLIRTIGTILNFHMVFQRKPIVD